MSPQSRRVAGIPLILVPTVEIGGASILSLLIADPTYAQNDLRQNLWRAGHAHAGVWLVLSLVALRYVDEATLFEAAHRRQLKEIFAALREGREPPIPGAEARKTVEIVLGIYRSATSGKRVIFPLETEPQV